MTFVVVPGFAGPTNRLDPINVDIERSINWYPEDAQPGLPKSPIVLRRTPGLQIFATVPELPIRGMAFLNDESGFVAGNQFYGLLSDGTTTAHGTVAVDAFPASIALNGTGGNQALIISGGLAYIYNSLTNTFGLVTGTDILPNVRQTLFLDGYFIVFQGESRSFQLSGQFDGTTWDVLDIAERTAGQDNIEGIATTHGELWIFGNLTTEVWTDTGNLDFPFEPINGVFLETGCCAPFSIQRYDNSLIWVGLDARGVGVVYKANGYTPQRISTTAVERALQQANYRSTLRFAQAFTYQFQGHLFYVLYVPDNETSWVYDASTGLWHEWALWNDQMPDGYSPHRATTQMFAYGMQLVGDRLSGTIYQLLHDQFEDEVTGGGGGGGTQLTTQILACLDSPSEPEVGAFIFQTFDVTTGASIAEYTYEDPPIPIFAAIYPFTQRVSDRAMLAAVDLLGIATFDDALVFASSSSVASPLTGGQGLPWIYTAASGDMFVVWANIAETEPVHAVVSQMDPVTFAQTPIWTNWTPIGSAVSVGALDIASDGSTLYYIAFAGAISPLEAVTVYALDMATGTSSAFATLGVAYQLQSICKAISTAVTGQVCIPWLKLANGSIRLVVYEADGAVTLDLDLTGVIDSNAVCVIETDGSAVWILGCVGGLGTGTWTLNRYLLPEGTLDVASPITISGNSTYIQLGLARLQQDIDVLNLPIRRTRAFMVPDNNQQWVFFKALQIYLETGIGTDDAPDPSISLRWSDDAGHTWSNYVTVSAGVAGAYSVRAMWRQLGRARNRVFEFYVDDPVAWSAIQAYMDVESGIS